MHSDKIDERLNSKEEIWSLYRRAADRFDADLDDITNINNNYNSSSSNKKSSSLNDDKSTEYYKKYKEAQRNNAILLISLKDKEKQIADLKIRIKHLLAERQTVQRVPEKNVSSVSSSSSETSRQQNTKSTTPKSSNKNQTLSKPLILSRQILRNAEIDSDILCSSSADTPRRPKSITNKSSSTISIKKPVISTPLRNQSTASEVLLTSEHTPAFYLCQNRPDFIQRSERRQMVIREATKLRSNLEIRRKDAVRSLALGNVEYEDVSHLLLADPTKIKAFPNKDMKAITKRRMSTTGEVKKNLLTKEKKLDLASNRIMSACFSLKTRKDLLGKPLRI